MLTPEQFCNEVSQWGSYMNHGDPGACLYMFDERGLVQAEDHRAECIAWLEDPAADNAMIDQLIAYLRAQPITPWTPRSRETRQ